VSLVTELSAQGYAATATPGTRGQFDVLLDGELVFSKHESGRFPEDGEVLGLLRRSEA
jgi:selT/selW/selH-like putative selenoprotein